MPGARFPFLPLYVEARTTKIPYWMNFLPDASMPACSCFCGRRELGEWGLENFLSVKQVRNPVQRAHVCWGPEGAAASHRRVRPGTPSTWHTIGAQSSSLALPIPTPSFPPCSPAPLTDHDLRVPQHLGVVLASTLKAVRGVRGRSAGCMSHRKGNTSS